MSARNMALSAVGQKPIAAPEKFAKYGNDPFQKKEDALPWNELVDLLKKTQAPLEKGLEQLSADTMKKPASFSPTGNPNETIGSLLSATAFHEAYHAGQLGLLRRLNGRAGTIKGPEPAKARA